MVSRCGAFKKGMTPMTLSPHVHRGTGFHPGNPCHKDMLILNGALSRESDTPMALSPLPPIVETFARNTTPAAHSPRPATLLSHDTSAGRSPAQLEAPPQHHQQAPADPTITAVSNQHHRRGEEEHHQLNTSCDNPPRKIPYYRQKPIHFGH
jgi:hypothetical protein